MARRLARALRGLVLEPAEVIYRQAWEGDWALGTTTEPDDGSGGLGVVPRAWRDWGGCHTITTSQRLATWLTADGSRLVYHRLASMARVQVDLGRDIVVLDDRASSC